MNPHQKNKIDISKLSEEEQKIFRMYGKMPNTKDLLQNKLKERKYFDSGDYALSKAGKASDVGVTSIGSQHPLPENIPHLTSPSTGPGTANSPIGPPPSFPSASGTVGGVSGQSGSPVKESSYLMRQTSADEAQQQLQQQGEQAGGLSPQQQQEPNRGGSLSPGGGKTVPIRWQS